MPARRRAPPKTQEAEDNELIELATNLARKQMMNGTASSQVITHYLKLGATREKDILEREKLRRENELLEAKTKAIAQEENIEKVYAEAVEAMKIYSGVMEVPDDYVPYIRGE